MAVHFGGWGDSGEKSPSVEIADGRMDLWLIMDMGLCCVWRVHLLPPPNHTQPHSIPTCTVTSPRTPTNTATITIRHQAPLHKTFAGVFYGKNSGNSGIFVFSIAICIKICQSFSMAKKKSGKKCLCNGAQVMLPAHPQSNCDYKN